MNGWIRPALLVAGKDLAVERWTKDLLTGVGLFSLLVVVVASFSFPTSGPQREGAAAGILWLAFLFAGLLGMGRSAALEREDACIEGLLSSPAPCESIFIGKLLSNLAFTIAAEAVMVPIAAVMLHLSPGSGTPLLALVVVLGTLALVTVGTLLAAMAASTRTREGVLPILAVPLVVPAMIAAVQSTEAALRGGSIAASKLWLLLLSAYSAVFILIAIATFPYVLEE